RGRRPSPRGRPPLGRVGRRGRPDRAAPGPGIALSSGGARRDVVPIPPELVRRTRSATMSQPALRWTVCGLVAALVALTSAPSRGQEKTEPPKGAQLKANPEAERASGVIVKVEPLARAGSEARGGL